VDSYKGFFAAEVYKAYLITACRIICDNNGEITAFDGDRVMAVYLGNTKNSDAARSALKINWAVQKVIPPALKKAYPNIAFSLEQAIGIDTSPLFVARTGIRGSNDLVWIGRSANYAAKLSAAKELGYSSIITHDVYTKLSDKSKYGGEPRRLMWEKVMWEEMGIAVYGSNWWWEV
jgi:class 3 adenylate cyclase